VELHAGRHRHQRDERRRLELLAAPHEPDSLSEFKILTGNTTAEFGRNSGGQVAMITRSGTNQYRAPASTSCAGPS